jgi:hypothetical protein
MFSADAASIRLKEPETSPVLPNESAEQSALLRLSGCGFLDQAL